MKNIGLLILVGGLVITFLSVNGFITQEKIIEVGELKISHNKKNTLDWPPYIGLAIAAIGAGVFVYGRKK